MISSWFMFSQLLAANFISVYNIWVFEYMQYVLFFYMTLMQPSFYVLLYYATVLFSWVLCWSYQHVADVIPKRTMLSYQPLPLWNSHIGFSEITIHNMSSVTCFIMSKNLFPVCSCCELLNVTDFHYLDLFLPTILLMVLTPRSGASATGHSGWWLCASVLYVCTAEDYFTSLTRCVFL